MGFQLSSGEPGTTSPGNAARADVIHMKWHLRRERIHSRITPLQLSRMLGRNVPFMRGVRRQGPTGPLAAHFVVVADAFVTRTGSALEFFAPGGRKRRPDGVRLAPCWEKLDRWSRGWPKRPVR